MFTSLDIYIFIIELHVHVVGTKLDIYVFIIELHVHVVGTKLDIYVLPKIEISLLVNFCFITNQNELKF